MIGVLGTVAAFVAVLVVLVLVHELGHFIVAKRAGITVQEFGIGFPPRIASLMWRGTRYSLNWIPLGGFVKMLGEDGDIEVQRLRDEGLTPAEIEHAMAGAFNRKPIGIRIAVLVAGVAMNFLLAATLFGVAVSMPTLVPMGPLIVEEVQADSPAARVGLRPDDVIYTADGRSFERSEDLTAYVASRAGEEVTLGIRRNGERMDLVVKPRELTDEQRAQGMGAIGFSWRASNVVEGPPIADGPLEAAWGGLSAAATLAWQIPGALVDAVGGLLGLNPEAPDAMGPIGIAAETGRILQLPLVSQLFFVGILSVNLAVLNVLPFPPLDGGRIAVVLAEALRRRRLPAEREALIYLTGFLFLVALVILISIQDIQRLISG